VALAGALFMVRLGARVLPIARNTKRALLKDWTRGASNDPDEVMAWAGMHPGCNWAMLCSQIAVLDVDQHPGSPDGHAALAELERDHGPLQTWMAHTPQGGRHYYFNQPKERVRNLKADAVGIELKGDGGYVLLPWSRTPHGAYRWDDTLCPGNLPRATLPPHVHAFVAGTPMKGNGKGNGAVQLSTPLERVDSGHPGKNPQQPANNGAVHCPPSLGEWTHGQLPKTALATWLETEVREGSRNSALARGVGLMAAAGTPMPAAEAAAKWWCRHRCHPPLVGQEVGRTFDSIFRAEAKKRLTESDDAASARDLVVHAMQEFTGLAIPLRSHVLGPILPEKGLAMLFAPRGVGKTYVALAMAYAIASAGRLLRWSAPSCRSVLYVDGEMPASELQERLRRLAAAHTGDYPDSLKILSLDMQEARVSLNLASELDQELIEQIDAEVLILDNRSTLVYAGRENDAESWDAMQPWLLRLRRANRTVLLVDHAGRGGFAARGTSKREDVLDTIIHLKRPSDYEPDQGARFEVHLEKARGVFGDDAKPFEAQLETTDGADHWLVKSLEDANAARVIEASEEGLSCRDIAKELGISKSTVHNIRRRHKFKVIDGGKGGGEE
jgi:DNA-directed RNA polymerase specialized sigma24 family protein